MQSEINLIAKKILDKINHDSNDDYGIDPITIIMIISVILTLIRVIQECRQNKLITQTELQSPQLLRQDIENLIIKNSWFNRLKLKKIIRQELNKEQYRKYGHVLAQSLMQTGINLTDNEVFTLMEAING